MLQEGFLCASTDPINIQRDLGLSKSMFVSWTASLAGNSAQEVCVLVLRV